MRRLLLCALALCPAAAFTRAVTSPQAARSEGIAGRVVSARDGRPLAHALVELEETGSTRVVVSAISAADGSFHLPAVPAGKYNLYGAAAGHLRTCYLQHGELCTGIVTGAGLDTGALTLSLPSGATLSGHVTENGGGPVEHASIVLYRDDPSAAPERVQRARVTQTDDLGAYEFGGLQPGTYFVSATATPWYAVHPPADARGAPLASSIDPALDVVYPITYFPAALSSDDAAPIVLGGGADVTANIALTPVHGVSVTLRVPTGDDANRHRFNAFQSAFGQPTQAPLSTSTTDGNAIRFDNLPPGNYQFQEFGNAPGSPGGAPRSVPVSVGTAAQTLDLSPGGSAASVTVDVRSADGKPLPRQTRVTLQGPEHRSEMRPELLDGQGHATFASVPAGDFRFVVFGRGTRSPAVLSLVVNNRPAPDRVLHVTGGEPLRAVLTLSGSPVSVQGLVKDAEKPLAGVLVVLVPAGADTDADLFHRDQTDLDGSFSLPNVVPGNYILVAIADGWSLPWRDAAALSPYLLHGVPLTVQAANAPTLRVSPPLTPARR